MSTLIFTIGQNGYDVAYRRCIDSQRKYADKMNASYVAVTEPSRMSDTAISAWLKIPLILHALKTGYRTVAFIDADAEIARDAPDFRRTIDTGLPVGMALGRSGRVNSGVVFARQEASSIEFFERVMYSLEEEIPDEARANLKYENGNVIYVTDLMPRVQVLDPRWNNTQDAQLNDFIRHYTGPLRETYRRGPLATLRYRAARLRVARPTSQPATRTSTFRATLSSATSAAVARYPALNATYDG